MANMCENYSITTKNGFNFFVNQDLVPYHLWRIHRTHKQRRRIVEYCFGDSDCTFEGEGSRHIMSYIHSIMYTPIKICLLKEFSLYPDIINNIKKYLLELRDSYPKRKIFPVSFD